MLDEHHKEYQKDLCALQEALPPNEELQLSCKVEFGTERKKTIVVHKSETLVRVPASDNKASYLHRFSKHKLPTFILCHLEGGDSLQVNKDPMRRTGQQRDTRIQHN